MSVMTPAEFEGRFVRCPEGGDHEWSAKVSAANPCQKCGLSGRENFNEATKARSEQVGPMRQPASAHGGKAAKR